MVLVQRPHRNVPASAAFSSSVIIILRSVKRASIWVKKLSCQKLITRQIARKIINIIKAERLNFFLRIESAAIIKIKATTQATKQPKVLLRARIYEFMQSIIKAKTFLALLVSLSTRAAESIISMVKK